jgi:rRNA-processing protein FCF1
MTSKHWSDENIQKLIKLRKEEKKTWNEMVPDFPGLTANALRKAFYRYEGLEVETNPVVESLKAANRSKKAKAIVLKENNAIIDYLQKRQDLLAEIKDLLDDIKFTKPQIIKPVIDKKKRKMTIEAMLTDLHYGKKTKTFNTEVAKRRMRKFGQVLLSEIKRYSSLYAIEKLITFLGGDIIENATFHGIESRRASEYGNSEQVVNAVKSLFEDYFVPIASTGIPMVVVCVTGNHDREDEHQTYQDPGRENLTWIIYKMLEQMCQLAGFNQISFIIPDGVFHVLKVYNSSILYEHGNFIKGGVTRKSCESHISKRSKQVGQLIRFARFGHFHEKTMFGRGRVIVNASLPGQDSYSEINGYDSEASQTINYYIETEDRPDPFYHSFPVCLE